MGHAGTCPSHAGAAFGVSASRVGEVISFRLPFQTLPRHLSSFLHTSESGETRAHDS